MQEVLAVTGGRLLIVGCRWVGAGPRCPPRLKVIVCVSILGNRSGYRPWVLAAENSDMLSQAGGLLSLPLQPYSTSGCQAIPELPWGSMEAESLVLLWRCRGIAESKRGLLSISHRFPRTMHLGPSFLPGVLLGWSFLDFEGRDAHVPSVPSVGYLH